MTAGRRGVGFTPWDHAADIVTTLLPPGIPWPSIEATPHAAAPGTAPAIGPRGLAIAQPNGSIEARQRA